MMYESGLLRCDVFVLSFTLAWLHSHTCIIKSRLASSALSISAPAEVVRPACLGGRPRQAWLCLCAYHRKAATD